MHPGLKIAGFMAIGAGLGYAYYALIGCVSGSCPITSNPWISSGYGALVGALTARTRRPPKK